MKINLLSLPSVFVHVHEFMIFLLQELRSAVLNLARIKLLSSSLENLEWFFIEWDLAIFWLK
jgi:hypothetical protein